MIKEIILKTKNMTNNLELWNKVEKTNPKYTKKANVGGNNITSIAPQYQIKNVTEQFGIYGKTWGFKKLEFDYTLAGEFGLVILDAVFFFPDGEFPIKNAQKLFMDNAKTKIDDNFAKKLETDTLTKAISKLGFNADIFLGLFDDVKYLQQVTEEYSKEWATSENLKNAKAKGFTIDDVKKKYKVTQEQEKEFLTL